METRAQKYRVMAHYPGSQPNYEEWKLAFGIKASILSPSSQPNYEEWKPVYLDNEAGEPLCVPSLTMRNGNQEAIPRFVNFRNSSQPNYEEWKQS